MQPLRSDTQHKRLEPLDQETPRCGQCGRKLHDLLLVPGTVIRYKCQCNTWHMIYVVAVAVAA